MLLQKFKATTPSKRHQIKLIKKSYFKGSPISKLSYGLTKTGGRNNSGSITVRHIGGGNKNKYRKIDFKRNIKEIEAKVVRLEYDPNRTAMIALLCYKNGMYSYILAPNTLKVNDIVYSSLDAKNNIGNALQLKNILPGSLIHNIENIAGFNGIYTRSAGTKAILINNINDDCSIIRLSSGKNVIISSKNKATIGVLSNIEYHKQVQGKAGYSRWRGIRPTVRGIAMNPVDHPHGGRTNGGRPSVTPWAIPTKGYKTVIHKKKKTNI